MIEKKFEFYIDTKPQNDFYENKNFAKKVDCLEYRDLFKDKNIDELTWHIEEYNVNTHNILLKNLFNSYKVPQHLQNRAINKFEKIKFTIFKITKFEDLPKNTQLIGATQSLTFQYTKNSIGLNQPFIIKILNNDCYQYDRFINYSEDFIVSKSLLDNSTPNGLNYRIFCNNRMLIERYFPHELSTNKIICEECFLNLKSSTTFKIVNDFNLIFKKITYNDKAFYPNSTEFILEP